MHSCAEHESKLETYRQSIKSKVTQLASKISHFKLFSIPKYGK